MPRKRPRKERKRRLQRYQYDSLRHRLLYVCDLFFAGNGRDMAFALDMCYRELYKIFRGEMRPTIRLVVHIASRLSVRVEWLTCGVGAVSASSPEPLSFQVTDKLQSSFAVFNTVESSAGIIHCATTPHLEIASETSDVRPYHEIGKAVYLARIQNKCVGFFLGSDQFVGTSVVPFVLPFYLASIANLLVSTLRFAAADILNCVGSSCFDITAATKVAAARGVGYGEAVAMSFPPTADRSQSLLIGAYDHGVPALIATEIGEIPAHIGPAFCGAEFGAALGAAAYIDLLILADRLRSFFTGGVFVVAGEPYRGVQLLLQQLPVLRVGLNSEPKFTIAVFSGFNSEIETLIHYHGGHVIFLGHPTTVAFTQLFQICNDVYAGKISHE